MFEALTLVLALAAIVVAWTVFRVERAAHRRDQLRGARSVLLAVQRGMVEGLPEQQIPGWGEVYFKQVYDSRTGFLRAQQSRKAVEGGTGIKSLLCRRSPSNSWRRRPSAVN